MYEPTIEEQIAHRVHDEIHECIRPGCTVRARMTYRVDMPIRVAGRDLMPGDFVDLCPRHDLELTWACARANELGFGTRFDGLVRMLVTKSRVSWAKNPLDRFREWPPD